MDFLFKTSALVVIGAIFAIIYIVTLLSQKRSKDITLLNIGSVFLSSSSIIGGLKLMITTFALLNDLQIESDKLYVIYGGFCVMYVSASSLHEKIKKPKELV